MFADMYKPHLSGVTNYIALYKERFEELGHEVFVLTFGETDFPDDEPNIVRSPALAWGDTGWQAGLVLSEEARRLIPTLDIAHAHHPFLAGRLAVKYCKPHGIPVVFTNHTRYDIYSDAYASFVPRRLRMWGLRRYLRGFMHDVDLVIAPSPGIKQWLADFGLTRDATLLSNCIDTRPFMNPLEPLSREEFGFAEDSIVFCYLGRVGPEKNMDVLLEAFFQVADAEPRACLMVLGDGPGRHEAQERVSEHDLCERAHFSGRTPYAIVPDYLAAADIFVTASVSEVHPLVIMEGMAAGLPAIGIDSPGVSDIIRDGVTGVLTGGSADEFASAMLRLARNAEERGRMSSAAVDEAAEYDIRIMADRMLGLYQELLAARPRLA